MQHKQEWALLLLTFCKQKEVGFSIAVQFSTELTENIRVTIEAPGVTESELAETISDPEPRKMAVEELS
jgi:hypothetical protein